jgi:hypothetical protein
MDFDRGVPIDDAGGVERRLAVAREHEEPLHDGREQR